MSDKIERLSAGCIKTEASNTFSFSEAIKELKVGKKVARLGWNGNGMYLILQQGYPVNGHLNPSDPYEPIPELTPDGKPNITQGNAGQMLSHILMKTAGDSKYWGIGYSDYVPWLASQTDILADDWIVIN